MIRFYLNFKILFYIKNKKKLNIKFFFDKKIKNKVFFIFLSLKLNN
jgi:hypothetical protein